MTAESLYRMLSFNRMAALGCVLLCVLCMLSSPLMAGGGGGSAGDPSIKFPVTEIEYIDMEKDVEAELGRELGLVERLKLRAKSDPFNIVATIIFLMAVVHTFLASTFNKMAHKYEHDHQEWLKTHDKVYVDGKQPVSFKGTLFHFLGEVEAIFGIWLIPLLICMVFMQDHGINIVSHYIDTRNYTEPIFVVIIMAIASSRPVIQFAETCMRVVANFGKGTPAAWWLSILVVAPLLGSFITEPAAMTIAALLLAQQFYKLEPGGTFKYATLGLLFVNVSVGGTLTHFAAPPVLMVAGTWHWNMPFMFTHFGWRAILGIIVATAVYFFLFSASSLRSWRRRPRRWRPVRSPGQRQNQLLRGSLSFTCCSLVGPF